jgi:uncharacterized membrane protein HdeD (DUF308 family)
MLYSVGMPLSDHERKMLAEMEAAFEQDDPRLVSTLTGKARTRQGSRMLLGLLLILGGIVVLFAGLIVKIVAIGLVGFIVALIGAFLLVTNFTLPSLNKSARSKKPSWSARLEGRWDRRHFNNE